MATNRSAIHSRLPANDGQPGELVSLQESFEERVAQAGGSFRLQQILSILFEHQLIQVARLRDALNVTYPTAASDLKRLEQAGILAELPNFEPRTYYSPELSNGGASTVGWHWHS